MRPTVRTSTFVLASAIATLLASAPAHALVYTVAGGDTEGLIAAIEAANATPEADLITLERGVFLATNPYQDGSSAFPDIRSPIRIQGNLGEIRRYASVDFRLFNVTPDGTLQLDHLTLADATLGVIRNSGTLRLRSVNMVDNDVRRASSVLENLGVATLVDCQISFNTVANANRDAGIVTNYGTLSIYSSTIQRNAMSRRIEDTALAYAVLNYGEAQLIDVRVLENDGDFERGALQAAVINLGKGTTRAERLVDSDNAPLTAIAGP